MIPIDREGEGWPHNPPIPKMNLPRRKLSASSLLKKIWGRVLTFLSIVATLTDSVVEKPVRTPG